MQLLISGSYNVFKDGYNAAGIYLASGLIESDSYTRPIYVGSAVNLRKRIIREHIPDLICINHDNEPMQSYAAKYGVENLVWFSLETYELKTIPAKNLIPIEQNWFDALQPFVRLKQGFNIAEKAGSTAGCKHNEEAKLKMSKSHKGKRTSEATKAKLSAAIKGRKHSEESKLKMSKAKKGQGKGTLKPHCRKTYTLISPNKELVTFTGINEFCLLNKLTRSNISQVLKGKRKHHKGWMRP